MAEQASPTPVVPLATANATTSSVSGLSWLLGVALLNVSSFTCTLGLVVQKWSTLQKDWSKLVWILGFAVFMLGNIVNAAALTLAPQSLLSCLAPTTLVYNSILSPCILGEKFTKYHSASIVCIFVGCFITVNFGLHPPSNAQTKLTVEQVWYFATRPLFLVLISLSGIVALSISGPIVAWRKSGLPIWALREKVSALQLMCLSCIFGAISITNTKITSTLFANKYVENENTAASTSLPYWILTTETGRVCLLLATFGIFAVAFFSIGLLNVTLTLYSSLTTVTLDCVLGLAMQSLYGAVFFEEYKLYSRAAFFGTVCGVSCSFVGLACLHLAGKEEERMMVNIPTAFGVDDIDRHRVGTKDHCSPSLLNHQKFGPNAHLLERSVKKLRGISEERILVPASPIPNVTDQDGVEPCSGLTPASATYNTFHEPVRGIAPVGAKTANVAPSSKQNQYQKLSRSGSSTSSASHSTTASTVRSASSSSCDS
ncbi:unnamed protein product [Amoebophrya sp. A120]|nr:unnamed protein product [Amoebophrya sp. A120]|eukprot:GSA120T00005409001.1